MAMARQSRAPTILLTRPLPQSQRFAAALAGMGGVAVVISPLMAPHLLRPALPLRDYAAVILTSETGAQAAAGLGPLPERAYCVGDRTAQVARDLGFEAISAQGDARALRALILAQGEVGPLLHLRGQDTRGDLAENLTAGGIGTDSVVVYDQSPQPLTPEAVAVIAAGGPLIVPVFSPRSARLLVQALADKAHGPLWLAALSPAVAEELRPLRPDGLETAERSDAEAMVLAVQRLIASACTP